MCANCDKVPEAVPYLIRALKDLDWDTHLKIMDALQEILTPNFVLEVIPLLQDKEKDVRSAAVSALGLTKSAEAIPYLLQALQDEDRGLRMSAVEALRIIIHTSQLTQQEKEQLEHLGSIRKILESNLRYDEKLYFTERLSILEATSSPYQDPFEPVKPSPAWKTFRSALAILAIGLFLGLLAILDILYGTAQDVFKNKIDPNISAWILTHPLIALFSLAIAIGLLGWAVERLKDAFEGRTKS